MKISTVLTTATAFLFLVDVVSSQGKPLVNMNGKCLYVSELPGSNQLVQTTCSRLFQRWSYNDGLPYERHICINIGWSEYCIASPMNSGGNTNVIKWNRMDEAGQRFTLKPDKATGYFRIVNDHGICLSVGQNSKDDGAWVYAWDCNTYEGGQLWNWY